MVSLTALAGAIPGVRQLYRERNELLAYVYEWKIEREHVSAAHASGKDDMNQRIEAIEQKIHEICSQNDRLIALCEQILVERHHDDGSRERLSDSEAPYPDHSALSTAISGEIDVCRALAARCVFVLGFARSSTTITLDILNTARNALILGEANLYQGNDAQRWRDFYNERHRKFGNQASKSTYAPDFIPGNDHTWWHWLEAASSQYDVIGDKMAFTSYHLTEVGPEAIRDFFEARFFNSRFVFLIRDPIDTLLSTAKLVGLNDDVSIRRECCAWLCYVQLWADWVRTFPHTLTIFAEELSADSVAALASFTGLNLDGAEALLADDGKHQHAIPTHFETLIEFGDALARVYGLARIAMGRERDASRDERSGCADADAPGGAKKSPDAPLRALYRLHAAARDLREKLGDDLTNH